MADVLSRALGNQILGQPERDYNHADDSQYKELRAAAQKELDKARSLSQQSQDAFKSGDKSKAHDLSEQSKQYRAKGDDLNVQAAQWVFRANNADSGPDEIDLHGLFVKESLSALDARVHAAQQRNESVLKVITGKGIHSASHQSKLKPAVQDYCRQNNLNNHIDQKNTGVIIINLGGSGSGQQGQNYGQNQNQQGQNQNYYGGQNQNQNHNNYQNNHQNQNHNNNNHNNNQDLMQQVNGWIKIFKQIRRAFRSCMG